jgi:TolB-like protein/Tfp pilus assembly protein PilF
MKRCPQCNRLEDDALAFCRVDGSPLEEAPTEVETSLLPHVVTDPQRVRSTGPTTVLNASSAQSSMLELKGANSRKHVVSTRNSLIAGAIGIVLVTALGIGSYLKYRRSDKQINSIAVMPFVNESGNTDVEYLSDGMTETLIKSLSQLPNLNVKARSSVFRYKGTQTTLQTIGKELNVQAVLNGRVVQRGDQLTLSLELIDAQTENVIWSEQYNRRQADLITLQSEIARDVSSQLKTKLSGIDEQKVTRSYTANPEAYQLYLKGRFHWNKRTYDDIQKAIEHFKAAVAKDDLFALAYTGLADSYSILPYYVGSKSSEFTEQARPYALRAVELDEQLAEAHTSLAFVNEHSWNWSEAEKEYQRAIELNADYSTALMRYARFEVRVPGRDVEGLARIKRALEIEPSSLVVNDNLSQIYLSQGQVDLAIEQAKRTVELDPSFSFGLLDLAYAFAKKGQQAEALATAERLVAVGKRSSRALVCLGVIEALSNRKAEAMAVLKELEERYGKRQADATEVAAVYAGLGDNAEAFAWLDKAFQDHSSLLVDLRVEFPFASLRQDSRFKELRRRMGMPE